MAVDFDAATEDTGGGGWSGSPRNFNHTPVGTPKGVVVLIAASDASDVISGVTYGGVVLSRVAAATKISTVSTEGGSVYTYFRGSGIPTGLQAVSISNTATQAGAVVITLTSAADTAVDVGGVLDSASVSNPAILLTVSADAFLCGVLWSGQNAVGSVAPEVDHDEIREDDFGSQVVSFIRRSSTTGGAGSYNVDWTATSEDAVAAAVAIIEAAAASATGGWFHQNQIRKRRVHA